MLVKYEHLIPTDEPPVYTDDEIYDQSIACRVMALILENKGEEALDLINSNLESSPDLLRFFVEILTDRYGKKKRGRKRTITMWYLLSVYEYYQDKTTGTEEERKSQLQSHLGLGLQYSDDLLDMGRSLAIRLKAEFDREGGFEYLDPSEWEEPSDGGIFAPYPPRQEL